LRQWKMETPNLPATQQPENGARWFVNKLGMTMVEIPCGSFEMGDSQLLNASPHHVTLTRPFFIADTEVRVDQFQRFVDDYECRALSKPKLWNGGDRDISPLYNCPAQRVKWHDAILFCNWLSQKEGRLPAYQRTESGEWTCAFEANGYRLATE